MPRLVGLTLLCLLALLAATAPAQGQGRLGPLADGMEVGIFSPAGEAAKERAEGRLGARYLYLTSGVEDGRRRTPGTPGGDHLRDWLRESAATGMVPLLTYYQLQSSAPSGREEKLRVVSALRSRATMRAYWREVRDVLRLAGADRRQTVVLQVEPDGWGYFQQLQGARTRALVGATGMAELRGLPDDVRGFARAFVRLRDRYAPNVALGWHLSAWGVGQDGRPSVQNSEAIGRLRATFLRSLGGGFDLVTHDPDGPGYDARSFAEHLALVRTMHQETGLPIVLFQVPADSRVAWLLGGDAAGRAHLQAEREAGVVAMLFDGGRPGRRAPRRAELLRRAAAGYADGRLG